MITSTTSGHHDRPADEIVGRERELAALREHALRARGGELTLVTVEGVAGIGKTALLRRFERDLGRFRVLHARCDRDEQGMPLAMLSQLAVGAECPSPVSGEGLLRLLRQIQVVSPVAILVDDIAMADEASVVALGYALRRLFDTRILIVVTARVEDVARSVWGEDPMPAHTRWRGLLDLAQSTAQLVLQGLGPIDLARSVDLPANSSGAEVGRRLHSYTDGNPARAKELLGSSARRGKEPVLLVPRTVTKAVTAAVAALPEASRDLLDALAVLGEPSPLPQLAYMTERDEPWKAFELLLNAGLVRWQVSASNVVDIAHPLQREVVYAAMPASVRARLHRAAAAIVGGDDKLRHRVAAADGVDVELSEELERAAAAALAGGEPDRAATHLLWAADVNPAPAERERLRATAALRLLWAGLHERARHLRQAIELSAPSAVQRCARGEYALRDGSVATAHRSFGEAVDWATAADAWLVARAHLGLATAYGLQGDGHSALQHAEKAAANDHADAAIAEDVQVCMVRGHLYAAGPAAALSHLRLVDELSADAHVVEHRLPGWRGLCELLTLDTAASLPSTRRALPVANAPECLEEDPRLTTAFARYLTGEWELADTELERLAPSGVSARVPWSTLPVSACAALLAAARGEFDHAVRLTAAMNRALRSGAPADHEVYVGLAEAGLAQARADHRAMLVALSFLEESIPTERNSSGRAGAWRCWWLPLRVEGLIGEGRFAQAAYESRLLTELSIEVPPLRVAAGWLAAWLVERRGGPGPALALYDEATGHDSVDPRTPRLHLAMATLAHGRALRAAGRRRSAMRVLNTARERFTALNAFAFLPACEDEFAQCGLTRSVATPTHFDVLTERERQVADMVRRGMSNQEVASRLFVSTKTVEFHLGNIYAKLGVRSRRDL